MNRILKENPDSIHDKKNNKYYELCDYDVITFGYSDDEVYWIGNDDGDCYTHCELAQLKEIGSSRNFFNYPGRLWQKPKIMTFWEYPSSKKELYRLLDKLSEETNIKFINNDWKIEIFDDETPESDNSIIIPIENYTGEYYNPEEHDHILPPMKKKKKIPPYNKYKNLKTTPAKYRYYKDKNVAEEIIKDEINEFIKNYKIL